MNFYPDVFINVIVWRRFFGSFLHHEFKPQNAEQYEQIRFCVNKESEHLH